MKYYKIIKNNILVGIGSTNCKNIPTNCRVFSYTSITEKQYYKLNLELHAK